MFILEITQKTTSKNRQERDDKVALIQLLRWSSGIDSSLQLPETNEPDLTQNIKESSSDTSTPLDWMSPPSPNSQNVTPAVEVTLTQRQSTRASRNVQMRKFIARTTATPQTCLAKLDKQVGNSRNDNGQISTPNRAESISKNRSLDVHISPSSNITTANKRTNVSSKQQQQTAKTKKEPEIIQNQQRDNQDHAALEVELKGSATQGVRYPTSVIPITERKIPIPKLERDMLQKSARLPTGRELTMSTQGTSTRGTSNESLSSPNSTQKSSKRDENGLYEPKKEQKNTSTTTPFSGMSSSSGNILKKKTNIIEDSSCLEDFQMCSVPRRLRDMVHAEVTSRCDPYLESFEIWFIVRRRISQERNDTVLSRILAIMNS
uniref:Uncharacterized protein n=1 Tax=Ascaris lumbricoides TaxID=6252 RepID=A0A9J2NZK1_ASCLU